jgi:hypothetical protein
MRDIVDKEKLLDRLAKFKKFNEWEEAHPCTMDAEEALAAIDFLYNLIPSDSRNSSPDITGIKKMKSTLSNI